MKPGDKDEEVDASTPDGDLWEGENPDDYSILHVWETTSWYDTEWEEGVEREFPHSRALDCTEDGCVCDLGDEPTVVEDWTAWWRYDVFVRFVRRLGGNAPNKVLARRFLLKGSVEARKRVIQGVCRRDPKRTIIAPFAAKDLPPRIGQSETPSGRSRPA
jgi:hypothetical protein